jgi:hypothetical protein
MLRRSLAFSGGLRRCWNFLTSPELAGAATNSPEAQEIACPPEQMGFADVVRKQRQDLSQS